MRAHWAMLVLPMLLVGCTGQVSDEGDGGGDPDDEDVPRVEFEVAESVDQLVVGDRTDEAADWARIQVRIVPSSFTAPLYLGQHQEDGYQNEKAFTSGLEMSNDFQAVSDISETMTDTPFEFLEFCADGQFSNLRLEVRDGPSGQAIGTYVFSNVAACSL